MTTSKKKKAKKKVAKAPLRKYAYTEMQRNEMVEAAYLIRHGFEWTDTKEGQHYWSAVENNLIELSETLLQ